MNGFLSVWVATSGGASVSPWYKLSASVREGIVIFSALASVSAAALLWVAFVRKRRSSLLRHHSHEPAYTPASPGGRDGGSDRHHRRKWRRRRRDHRPRNPTLAETGGLPPIRSEEPPESPL